MNEESLFAAAREKPSGAEREAFLDAACGGDLPLRERLGLLLAGADRTKGVLERAPDVTKLTDRDPLAVSPALQSALADRFRLVRKLGEGGMGEVWVAEQIEPVQRQVALKLIRPSLGYRELLARFEQERQALALMDHPNIAKVFDAGVAEGRPYFVMELIPGVNLTRYCDEAKLSLRQRLELFVPICQAVQHAHQKGVIHRDLKPSNILVAVYDGVPVPKIIDFGVAKATGPHLGDHTYTTQVGAVIGTLEYMSPEQAQLNPGANADIDTRSDVYALGVILYEMMTGLLPIDAERLHQASMAEMLRIIQEEEPSKPSTRLSTAEGLPSFAAVRQVEPRRLMAMLRGELDWVVMKCLEKQRERRYESAGGLARDLQRFLADDPVEARPPSAAYRLRKFVKRNKGSVIAASVVLFCLVAGIIGTSTALVWAIRERDDKDKALQGEIKERQDKERALAEESKARAAEKQARDKAMTALRAMSDHFIGDQMSRATQLTQADRDFLRQTIQLFESFAAMSASDADSRAIRGEGYFRVGLIRHRLGELQEAEKAFADAIANLDQLVIDSPATSIVREVLARSHLRLGAVFHETSRLGQAEIGYTRALEHHKQLVADLPDRAEFRQNLALCYANLGMVFGDTGRLKDADRAQANALEHQKQLVVDFPSNLEFRRRLAASHNDLGVFFRATARFKEAEAAHRTAIDLLKQVDIPAHPEFRHQLAISHMKLGVLLSDLHRAKESEAASAAALAIYRQLAAEFPAQPEYRRGMAASNVNLGVLFYRLNRPQEAELAYRDALALFEKLAADYPTQSLFRHEFAKAHINMGNLLDKAGRVQEAEKAHGAALLLLRPLCAAAPNDSELRNSLAGTFVNLANLRSRQKDFREAKALLEEARPHHEAALKANSRNETYRHFYRNNLYVLIRAHAGLGDEAAAKRVAEQMRDLGWDAPHDAYQAARGLARCIPLVRSIHQSATEERDKQVAFYSDESMKMLRDAAAKGHKNVEHTKKDTDLDSLRERPDFKKLLAELEAEPTRTHGR